MPMIQLIRRDSTIIELEAVDIQFSIQRKVLVHTVPLLATRAALDLNTPEVGITINGIITDDEQAKGDSSAEMTLDLSLAFGSGGAGSWYQSLDTTWANVKTEMDGASIKFSTKGQIDADLGESIELQLKNGSGSNVVATASIIYADISSTTNTSGVSSAIKTALEAASVKVNGSTVAFTTEATVSTKAGQAASVSYNNQNGSAGAYTDEMLVVKNKATGASGNSTVAVRKIASSSSTNWTKQFFVSDFSGGVDGVKMTRGDKLQDLLNSITNPSAGGALISPNVLTGSLIDLPDSIASFDSAQFLRIDQAKAVKKYIVGVRIPYESIVSSTSGNRELRQFLIPAGPGTDHSAESNTQDFDPVEIINNKPVRPNPYLQQGVAIPCVVQSFDPSYEAGDSVWNYQITLMPVEQLVGL